MHSELRSKKIFIVLCVAGLFLFFGCDKKADSPRKPREVGNKITIDSGDNSKAVRIEGETVSGGTADAGNNSVTKKIPTPEKSRPHPEKAAAKSPAEDSVKLDQAGQIGGVPGAETSSVASLAENDPPTETVAAKPPSLYDPTDKIDPFMPLFKDEPEEKEEDAPQSKKRKTRVPRTPLERIDISQLKLVGVIQAPSGDRGLVEEASGKGYIVSIGAYMGTNGGKVTEILKDRIVVEEEVEDILGKYTIRKRELKLQKPFGEK